MWKVMNVTGLKFFTNEAKKLATAAIGISKKIVKTCFRIQYNAAVFPFVFAYGGIVYASKWFFNFDSENAPYCQPSNDVVVRNVQVLRNTAISNAIAMNSSRCHNQTNTSRKDKNKLKYEKQLELPDLNVKDTISMRNSVQNDKVASIKMNEFSGQDILWDIPIISAKAKFFAHCIKEERDGDIMEARKALEQHPLEIPLPKTRKDFNDMKNKAENKSSIIEFAYAEIKKADNCNANDCDLNSFEENYRQKREVRSHDASSQISPRRKIKYLYNPLPTQDKIKCREISTVNKTLRKIQTTCSRLLGELSNLNEALTKVISMKEELANLEFQVDEGKKLLQEVECDRFIMKAKLSALEKLINEEEKFLSGDVFCESGFYESVETTGEF